MKRYTVVRIGVLIVGVAWFWQLAARSLPIALAHYGGPRLRVTPQIAPGATLEVEGINLGTDLPVSVVLEKDGRRQVLGETLCDGHGDFVAFFALPEELAAGVYTVAVIDHSVAGMEVVMANSDVRIGRTNGFSLAPYAGASYVFWAGAGTALLALLLVPLVMQQRRAAEATRTRLLARRKVQSH